jgi:hypothetical protein
VIQAASVAFNYDQTVYLVLLGKEEHVKLPVYDGHLLAFESWLQAGPLACELRDGGVHARVLPMAIGILACLARGQDAALLLSRHNGTLVTIDDTAWDA